MKYEYNGHTIKVDRIIASLVLKIDGDVVDRVTGLSKVLDQDSELHGTISNQDGSMTTVRATIENNAFAATVTLYCDNQEVAKGILI